MVNISSSTDSRIAPGISVDEKPRFVRCKKCRGILRKEEMRDLCPQCGTGKETEPWPDSVGARVFHAVEEFFERQDKELTVILACDFLEMLLEMFFRDLFVKQGKPPSWIQLTLRKNKSLDLRLRYLFKEILHVGFPSAIQGTPFEGFDRRWAMIRSTKSVLLHARPPAIDEKTAREAYDLSRISLALFAWLNNEYCV